ncbi:MAG: nucleotide exchange factor GrpE [Verrucomicrobiota bacterium]|nr:nucleotide exchange factor GrpE [Limisphaera sp.]MDW8380947.1 nucleotide exchange factor GrpE [Verrucomicrobiota bacterium]
MRSEKPELEKPERNSVSEPVRPCNTEEVPTAEVGSQRPDSAMETENLQAQVASGNIAATVTLSAQEWEELRRQAGQAAEYRDRLLRTAADFDNFRKRAVREKQEVLDHAHQALLTKLIPVLDSFEAALAALSSPDNPARDKLEQGVRLVWQQFRSVLQEAGLTEIDATGQTFDPAIHEAVAVEERADVPDQQVIRQIRKGYKLRDRLLRPASVVVAHSPARSDRHDRPH